MSRFYLSKSYQIRSNVNDSQPYNIIIKDMEKNKYSKEPKTALVRPVFKKNENNTIRNYRPLTILNGMSKIYERCIHNSLSFMLKQYYQISYQLIKNPIVQIMSY